MGFPVSAAFCLIVDKMLLCGDRQQFDILVTAQLKLGCMWLLSVCKKCFQVGSDERNRFRLQYF